MKIVVPPIRRLPPLVRQAGLVCCLLLDSSGNLSAEGFRILDQSAAATGQGAAFAAQANDASAVHFNPAALVRLPGIHVTFGSLLLGGHIDFHPLSGDPVQGDFGGSLVNPPPSSFFLTANLGSIGFSSLGHMAVGLGVHSPFGNLTNYPKDSSLSTVTRSSALPLLDIKPTVAVDLNEFLSMGFGLDIYTFSGLFGEGHVEVQQDGQDLTTTGIATAGDEIELNGTDTAIGYNVSFLFTPLRNPQGHPLINFAFVYRSQTELHLQGSFINHTRQTSLNAMTELNLPQIVTVGIAVWPTRTILQEWKCELDVDYADWTSFQNLDVTLSNGLILPKPKNWQNSYTVMLGTEYKLLTLPTLPNWEVAVRGGYVYGDSPVPEKTFSPDVPDATYQALSVGLGIWCKPGSQFLGLIACGNHVTESWGLTGIGLDLAFQALLYQTRDIHNNIDPLRRVNGTWDTTIYVGAVNLHMIFDRSS